MKNLKLLLVLLIICIGFAFSSCSGSVKYSSDDSYSSYESSGEGEWYSYSSKGGSKSILDGKVSEAGEAVPGESEPGETDPGEGEEKQLYEQVPAGQLSASAYDDNVHYTFWKQLLTSGQTEEDNGVFYTYYKSFSKYFTTLNRLNLTFTNGVPEKVCIVNEAGNTIYVGYPLKNGQCYLFPTEKQEQYKIEIYYQDQNDASNLLTYTDTITGDKTYDMNEIVTSYQSKNANNIDLMFVIDTTGSMGDEMVYLEAELADVIQRVAANNEGVTIRISVMIYRDTSDVYVTRYSDFTTDISKQVNFLKTQCADGGGDFEEAVEVALDEAIDKKWSDDNSTKLLVFVADAPAHDEKVGEWSTAVSKLAAKGIRIITVASSGIDKKTEYFFRCQSMITGGIYTYLTDDSGIGGSHIVATTEETPVVEFLNSMLVRLITGYHTGDFGTPVSYHNDNTQENNQQE